MGLVFEMARRPKSAGVYPEEFGRPTREGEAVQADSRNLAAANRDDSGSLAECEIANRKLLMWCRELLPDSENSLHLAET